VRRLLAARRCAVALVGAALSIGAFAREAIAQRADDLGIGVRPEPILGDSLPDFLEPMSVRRADPLGRQRGFRDEVLPPLASALLPGGGQALLGQDRFIAYLAVEGFAWLRYATDVAEARRQRRAYRALAERVARSAFGDSRPVGDFEYYERMKHWVASGAFDLIPGGAVDPETDTTTFNGAVWLLARRTYWTDPDATPPAGSAAQQQALSFYLDRAIGPAYRWSWSGAELEQDVFGQTIDRSNDAYRRTIEDLGLVLANHVLSTVDAYVTVRLRARREPGGSLRIGATVPWSPPGW
jgi:hypothetical protein